MDLQNLFILQKGVDKKFNVSCNIEKNSLLPEKILGLQVKISELVNLTQCYKFWIKENSFSNNKVLNEFVKGINYILSIGLDKNYTNIHLDVQETQTDLTTQFINLYIDINDFVVCPNIDNYKTLFENFLSIGLSLGFEKETIEKAYLQKNLILHEKQVIAKS